MTLELECPVCGDVAFVSDDNIVHEDQGEVCASCGHPGHVSIQEDPQDERRDVAYWSAAEVDLSTCPYYRGEGTCGSGCYSEPSCITDRPLEGWPSERGQP